MHFVWKTNKPIPIQMQTLVSLALFFLMTTSCQNSAQPAFSDESINTGNFRQEMLAQVNQLRKTGCRCGRKKMPPAPPLRWNNKLEKAATGHARYLAKRNKISHRGSRGSRMGDRIRKAGYGWQTAGENVAWGAKSVREVILDWKDSPGHCETMMSKNYKEIGAARQGRVWVQNFGRRW